MLVARETLCSYADSVLSCAGPFILGGLPSWNQHESQRVPGIVGLIHRGGREECLLFRDGGVRCVRYDPDYYRDGPPKVEWYELDLPSPAVALGGGMQGIAALRDGRVVLWGDRENLPPDTSEVSVVDGLSAAVGVANGGDFSCALLAGGTVSCWNYRGNVPKEIQTVAGVVGAKTVVAGSHHACALVEDGRVQCWGSNEYGQRGTGEVDDAELDSYKPGFYIATFVELPAQAG